MKTLKQLRDERAVIDEQQRDIVAQAEKEGRDMSAEEWARFEKFQADWKAATEEIEKAEKLEAFRMRQAEQEAQRKDKGEEQEKAAPAYKDVFAKYIAKGQDNLSQQERAIMSNYRAQGTSSDSAGGYLVPEGFSNEVEKRMKEYGGMLQVARIFETSSGNLIPWPTVDDTSNTGAILTENTQFTDQDATFGVVNLNAYTYHSKQIRVSMQLLQDAWSTGALEQLITDLIAERLGRIMNTHFTDGTGSSQPTGFVTAAVANGDTRNMAANNAITRTEILNVQHDVDPAYRGNGRYMFNDGTLATIKALALGSGDARPLWQPSMRDGTPDMLEGYPYTINQDMDSIGGSGNLYPVAFGDFSKYIIRTVSGIQFLRLNERYMDYLQVGFSAWMRADGNLVQNNNAIALLRTPAT